MDDTIQTQAHACVHKCTPTFTHTKFNTQISHVHTHTHAHTYLYTCSHMNTRTHTVLRTFIQASLNTVSEQARTRSHAYTQANNGLQSAIDHSRAMVTWSIVNNANDPLGGALIPWSIFPHYLRARELDAQQVGGFLVRGSCFG